MNCPRCGFPDSRVVDSRKNDTYINRRRVCRRCGFRFQTVEIAALDEANFTRLQTVTRKTAKIPRQFENMVFLMYCKIFEKRMYREMKG